MQTEAERVLRFVRNLHLTGDYEGLKFAPRDWQEEIYRRLFETDENGKLVTRDALLLLPRKVGKTFFCATVSVVALFTFGRSQCILSVAASKLQARFIYEQVRSIIEQDDFLRRQCKITKDRIDHLPSGSYFLAAPASGDAAHGHNPTVVLIDEFHAWKQKRHKDTFVALTTGSSARKKRLTIKISTQTTDRHTLAGEEFEFARKLKNRIVNGQTITTGEVERRNYLAVLYYLPADADWHDRSLWTKVCPGLGDWVSTEEFENKYRDGCDFPSRANHFKVFYLNMPATENERWMNMDLWRACKESYTRDHCGDQVMYLGLDVAPVDDLSSATGVIPQKDGSLRVLQWSWLNEAAIESKEIADYAPWESWRKKGLLIPTEGNTTDTKKIAADIIELSKKYRIKTIAADQLHAYEVGLTLQQAGLNVRWHRPYFANMAPPTDRVEKLVLERTLRHNGDELLNYCVSNVRCETDSQGNQRPCNDRRLRHEKVDAAIAMIYAVSAWMEDSLKPENEYERRARVRKEAQERAASS